MKDHPVKFEDSIAIAGAAQFDEQAKEAFKAGWRPFDAKDPSSAPHSFLPAKMPSISMLAGLTPEAEVFDPYRDVVHTLVNGGQVTPDMLQRAWPNGSLEDCVRTAKFLNATDKARQMRFASALAEGDRKLLRSLLEDELTEINRRKVEVHADRILLECMEQLKAIGADPKLQRLDESGLHKLSEALAKADVDNLPFESKIEMANLQVFLVQHNWSAAFKKATDYTDGEWRLPYKECAFELRISGIRFIALCDADAMEALLTAKLDRGWYCWGLSDLRTNKLFKPEDGPQELASYVGEQIRAICIALDAEVATTEIIRAPHKLNAKRIKAGKLPLFDHHVVDLSRRQRVATPLPLDPGREITHRRMHFVRGHWRHYEAHKTWIKWHLRGDPDLGFIDKEYRL